MFRLRSESRADAWRSFRWSTYLLTAAVAPLGIAGALSVGGGFGASLLGALLLSYGLTIFGVEFTIRMGKQPQTFEFDTDGIRFSGPGRVTRTLLWRDLSRLRIRAGGPRSAPTVSLFQFRAGVRYAVLGIDLMTHQDVAERVAAMVARHAPDVGKSGRTELFRWNPTLVAEGEVTVRAPAFEPLFYAGMGLMGPATNLYLTIAGLVVGLFQESDVVFAMVGAYLVLGTAQLLYSRRAIRGIEASRGRARSGRTIRAYLLAGLVFVVLEGVVGLRVLYL